MNKYLLVLLVAALSTIVCCRANDTKGAYIAPDSTCGGYVVMLGDPIPADLNPQLSKCMPIDDARALADLINKDMVGKWSGGQ